MINILYILLAVVILLIMVVIHEFGHYIAGKILKFKINEFSVGFGPKLISKKMKNGEVFSLRLIPLGGYCAFEGETDDDNSSVKSTANAMNSGGAVALPAGGNAAKPIEKSKSFVDEKPWKRIIVLLSGGVFNLISAVIFSFLFIFLVGYGTPTVTQVYNITPTENQPYSSLQIGDEITAINGTKISVMNTYEELFSKLSLGDQVTVTVKRGGILQDVSLTLQTITVDENSYVGFGFQSERNYHSLDVGYSFLNSVPFTAKMAWSILGSFFNLLTGQIPITSLTGPVGTVGMMASLSQANWRNILILLPLIAANLGLFNLLPIPALDGSKVVFTGIEWVRGKPINRKVENYIHSIGMILLLAFVVIVDVVGLFLR